MTIFTKIIKGEIPCYKVFEDDLTFAFLDVNPINLGHTLIVPKVEVDYFLEVPEPYYSRVFQNGKIVGKALAKATTCLRVCTWTEGFQVPHFHFHVCPFYSEGEFWHQAPQKFGAEQMKAMQAKILSFLEN